MTSHSWSPKKWRVCLDIGGLPIASASACRIFLPGLLALSVGLQVELRYLFLWSLLPSERAGCLLSFNTPTGRIRDVVLLLDQRLAGEGFIWDKACAWCCKERRCFSNFFNSCTRCLKSALFTLPSMGESTKIRKFSINMLSGGKKNDTNYGWGCSDVFTWWPWERACSGCVRRSFVFVGGWHYSTMFHYLRHRLVVT